MEGSKKALLRIWMQWSKLTIMKHWYSQGIAEDPPAANEICTSSFTTTTKKERESLSGLLRHITIASGNEMPTTEERDDIYNNKDYSNTVFNSLTIVITRISIL